MENSNEKEDMRALIMVFVIWLLLWCVDNRQSRQQIPPT